MEKKITFTPKQWVLAKVGAIGKWHLDIYSDEDADCVYCVGSNYGRTTSQVIPFEGNEHLLSTTDDCAPPYEPKDGDFIIVENEGRTYEWIAIFKSFKRRGEGGGIFCYVALPITSARSMVFDTGFTSKAHFKPATKDEKKQLLDKLHEDGKDWDVEKKEFVDCKWTPQEGERVWRIEFNSAYTEFNLIERIYDSSMALSYKNGLIFKLYDEMATKKANQMTEAVKNVK